MLMNDPLQIGNIRITHDRLAQLDRSHTVASVTREDFLGGEIRFQRVCKQPLVLSLLAIAMIWFGLRTGWGIVEWLIGGGTVYDVSIMMILLLPGGLAFLYQAWRQAPMLIIQTRHDIRRIEFKGDRSEDSITALKRAAGARGFVLR